VKVLYQDALEFIKGYKDYFDIIIDDLTDPTGPSTLLWGKDFYKLIFKALRENGVAGFQTAYLKEKFAKKTREGLKRFFPFFAVHRAYVGCFPFDEHTFSFVSKKVNFKNISQKEITKKFKVKTRYYSPEIHFSSLVMPKKSKED
jgi:spermidine synthase